MIASVIGIAAIAGYRVWVRGVVASRITHPDVMHEKPMIELPPGQPPEEPQLLIPNCPVGQVFTTYEGCHPDTKCLKRSSKGRNVKGSWREGRGYAQHYPCIEWAVGSAADAGVQ